jgi:hypothetical protein
VAAAVGWNDDGFDDWNFDDVKEEKKIPKKVMPKNDKWAPPAPDNKLTNQLGKKNKIEPKVEKRLEKKTAAVDSDDGWGEIEPTPIDTRGIDYNKLNLNKLSDYELNRHKAAMDKEYQKNFLKKGDAGFEYDKKVDFTNVNK